MTTLLVSILRCPTCKRLLAQQGSEHCSCGNTWKKTDKSYIFLADAVKKDFRPSVKKQRNWSSLRKFQHAFLLKHVKDIPTDALIIDVGAGERQFANLFTSFKRYFAMDFVQYPDIDIVADLTQDWPVQDGVADIIIATNTLEHLPDTNHVLRESARVLASGGTFYITVPFLMGVHQAPYDFVRHTHFSWIRLAEEHGFELLVLEVSGTPFDTYQLSKKKMQEAIMQEPRRWKRALLAIPTYTARILSSISDLIYESLAPTMQRKEALAMGYQMVWRKK